MDLPGRTRYSLIGFMVAVILCFKYPRDPHEYGIDSFVVHGMAGNILEYNYAPWLLKPSSAYALYPFSYAPGIPIVLAALSEVTGLSIEMVILGLSIIISLLGVFGMFMFAGEIKNKFEVRFLSAFLFAFTPAISTFTTWTISTRGPFICIMTILLWTLARIITARHKSKYIVLSFIFLVTLPTIHHFGLLLPILLLAMTSAYVTVLALEYTDRVSVYYRENVKIASGVIFLIMIILFYLQVTSIDLYGPDMAYFKAWYIYGEEDNPYTTMLNILVYYGISMGVLMLYGGVGLANVLEKVDKTRMEWTLLFFIVFFSMFMIDKTYLKMFVVPLFLPLAALGINILLGKLEYRKGMFATLFAVILLVAAYYGDYATEKWSEVRTVEETGYHHYMDEAPYNTAIYIRYIIDNERDINAIHNDITDKRRISAISGMPMLPLNGQDVLIAYPEITEKVIIEKQTIFEMYSEGDDQLYYVDWENSTMEDYDNYSRIVNKWWGDPKIEENLTEFRISWAIVNVHFPEEYGSSSRPYINARSRFFISVPDHRYKIYENGYERIYYLMAPGEAG